VGTKVKAPGALTFADAAAELAVSVDTVARWARAGHFNTFVPPGQTLDGGKTGPKTLRILRDDWDHFVTRCRQTGAPRPEPPSAAAPPRVTAPDAAGTDGVSRRNRRPVA
jgi:hypothetical protein